MWTATAAMKTCAVAGSKARANRDAEAVSSILYILCYTVLYSIYIYIHMYFTYVYYIYMLYIYIYIYLYTYTYIYILTYILHIIDYLL